MSRWNAGLDLRRKTKEEKLSQLSTSARREKAKELIKKVMEKIKSEEQTQQESPE